MRTWTVIIVIALSLFLSFPLLADECMEGDCDNGVGTGFTVDNQIYEGEWKDGVPHGQGTLHLSKGKVVTGRWEKGELMKEESVEKESDANAE